jgi:protoheme IX farnesyltransferase
MAASKLRAYYKALKPERTYANVMTTAAGFLFASKWHIHGLLFLATITGTTLIVMSACAANNCTDRGVDGKMPRTRKRSLVTGELPFRNVALLAVVLGIAGFTILGSFVNWLTVLLGAIAYIDYVVLYAWSKRTTIHSTLIGTISGAVPLVAGYTAVTNRFDTTAAILGLIMVFWQMPHFYAIGIFRKDDYTLGGLPIWPVQKGVRNTQWWILIYTGLYVMAALALTAFSSAGWIYGSIVGVMGLYWLYKGISGLSSLKPEKWARGMFGFSLVTLLVLSGLIATAPLLP